MDAGHVPNPLASPKGFVDLSAWRKIAVSGTDALTWLDAMVAGGVAEMAPGQALVTSINREAEGDAVEFMVAIAGSTVLLIEDPGLPLVAEILSAHRGTADVSLEDRTHSLALFAFPGRAIAPNAPGTAFFAPSPLGTGVGLVGLMEEHRFILSSLTKAFTLAGEKDLARWRAAGDEATNPL